MPQFIKLSRLCGSYCKKLAAMSCTVEEMLKNCSQIVKPTVESDIFQDVVKKSDKFPILFPVQSTRACGSDKEKALYGDLDIVSFIDRLLKKRAVSFYGAGDKYILYSKKYGFGGWEKVGSDNEVPPLVLEDCLSYDEMRLSAMLYVSGPTIFINDGSRFNAGNTMSNNNTEQHGVIMGLIGTRFEVPGKMEYQDVVIDRKQNVEVKGYGKTIHDDEEPSEARRGRNIWAEFYGLPRFTYYEADELRKEVDTTDKTDYIKYFVSDGSGLLFDNRTYARHLSMPFDCALLEASTRGQTVNKSAYLHVVGIGLGVWKIFSHQSQVFVKTFLDRIESLVPQLSGLSDVHFAYFRDVPSDILPSGGMFVQCSTHPLGGIKVHLSKREPSSKLKGPHEGKLLVETYAWDGNAQPGNEFWDGSLTGSGDPAAACSSQVAELHNSHINTTFVSGSNLHVAGKHGLHYIARYAQLMLDN